MSIKQNKIVNLILYFANKSEGGIISRLKLIKLIWLSDRLHLNKYGRLIIKDRYKALPRGPIASNTLKMLYHSLPKVYKVIDYNIKSESRFDKDYFSRSDLKVMDYVWRKFGQMNEFQLSDYSHLFPEWLRYKEDLNTDSFPNSYDIVIQDFFKSPLDYQIDFSDLFSEQDSKLSEQEFNIHRSIQSLLSS